jgi:hypothetical protein
MTRIFISYSSEDRLVVAEPASDLKTLFELEVWYDQALNRSGGNKWWNLILEAMQRGGGSPVYGLNSCAFGVQPCHPADSPRRSCTGWEMDHIVMADDPECTGVLTFF